LFVEVKTFQWAAMYGERNFHLWDMSTGGSGTGWVFSFDPYDAAYADVASATSSSRTLAFGTEYANPVDGERISLAPGHSYLPITLDAQDADDPGSENAVVRSGRYLPPLTLPTRLGYEFDGYYGHPKGKGTRYYRMDPVTRKGTYDSAYGLSVGSTLYANWIPISYTIAFSSDGEGAGAVEDIAATYDVEYALPVPVRPGYAFMGWDTQADGKGTRYQVGDVVKNLTTEAGATVPLYAQWTLSYDLTLPICDPAEVTFKVDATTGEVSAVGATANEDGIHHDGAVASSMAVPVALSSVSLEALKKDDGTYGLASIFPGDDPLGKARLTMKAKDAEASVAFGKTETAVADFVVPSVDEGGKLSVSYGLELSEGVGPADIASDTGEKAVPVGKLTYTADVIGGIASVHDFFTLDDGRSGRVLGAELIKRDAEHIAALHGTDAFDSDSTYLKYKGWLEQDHRFYAKWQDGNLYEVRIIGINHDDKADGTGKAGLTFQFVERLAPHDTDKHGINQGYRMMGSTSVVGKYGWGRSELRARMNPNDDPLVSAFTVEVGTDDNAIWNLVPSQKDGRQCLGDVMVPVKKRYYAAAAGGTITANDKMFLASVAEHIGTTFSDGKVYGTLNSEGSQYEFWAQPESASEMHKTYGKWTRSHYPNLTYYASTGVINSVQFSHPDANVSFAVVPCFCL